MEVKAYFEITPETIDECVGLTVLVDPHEFPMVKGEIESYTDQHVIVKVGERKTLTCDYGDVILCCYQWDKNLEFRSNYVESEERTD